MRRLFNRKNGVIAVVVLALLGFVGTSFIWYANRPPEKEEIRIGFTWISPGTDENGDSWGVVLEESNLRVTYTTGMVVVQNKDEPEADPYMFGGGTWYFRQPGGKAFRVVVISGNTKVAEFDNVMVVTNACPEEPCRAGEVWVLNNKLENFQAETSAHQFVVVNP